MGLYYSEDLETTDDGDLVIDGFGDLKIANPMRTIAQCLNNLLLTDRGDLRTEPSFGANIGSYIGRNNTAMTRNMMERDIIMSVRQQQAIIPEDFTVDVMPVDVDKVGIIASVDGSFLYQTETTLTPLLSDKSMGVNMAYIFPFADGQLKRATS